MMLLLVIYVNVAILCGAISMTITSRKLRANKMVKHAAELSGDDFDDKLLSPANYIGFVLSFSILWPVESVRLMVQKLSIEWERAKTMEALGEGIWNLSELVNNIDE